MINPVISKLKAQLRMAINRLKLVQQKQNAIAKQQRRDLAQLLENGKEQSAKIRVEIIIHEDVNNELLEILELYCELLLARSGLLDQKECDPGLEEAVKTIIYSAPRTEVKELHQVRELLIVKFGKEFAKDAIEEAEGVPPKVMKRLTTEPPSEELVNLYLCEIAKTYKAPYSGLPKDEDDDDDDDEGNAKEAPEPVPVAADSSSTSGSGSGSGPAKSKEQADLDALKDRFNALRRP